MPSCPQSRHGETRHPPVGFSVACGSRDPSVTGKRGSGHLHPRSLKFTIHAGQEDPFPADVFSLLTPL